MGQKVHPFGLRLGIIQDWRSRWYAERGKYAEFLDKDIQIRRYLYDRLARAGIARIEIERADKSLNIAIHTARPGIVIGKGGIEVDQVRKDIEKIAETNDVEISVLEVRFPELDANLVAQNVAEQLIARVPFRRAMKRAVSSALKTGAKGIKVMVAGRLGGSEMARTEWYREGQVPLHTLRADIDYGYTQARTTFGSIGVKAWIYKGEKTSKRPVIEEEPLGLAKPKGQQAQKVQSPKPEVGSQKQKEEKPVEHKVEKPVEQKVEKPEAGSQKSEEKEKEKPEAKPVKEEKPKAKTKKETAVKKEKTAATVKKKAPAKKEAKKEEK